MADNPKSLFCSFNRREIFLEVVRAPVAACASAGACRASGEAKDAKLDDLCAFIAAQSGAGLMYARLPSCRAYPFVYAPRACRGSHRRTLTRTHAHSHALVLRMRLHVVGHSTATQEVCGRSKAVGRT